MRRGRRVCDHLDVSMKRRFQRRGASASWRDADFSPDGAPGRPRGHAARDDKRTDQLCAQAQRALSGALDELSDPRTPPLCLLEVRPLPDATHLLAVISVPEGSDLELTREILDRARSHLREAVARAIA